MRERAAQPLPFAIWEKEGIVIVYEIYAWESSGDGESILTINSASLKVSGRRLLFGLWSTLFSMVRRHFSPSSVLLLRPTPKMRQVFGKKNLKQAREKNSSTAFSLPLP